MSAWGNSKQLTASSYELVKQNPGMNRYAVKAAVHGSLDGVAVHPRVLLDQLVAAGGELLAVAPCAHGGVVPSLLRSSSSNDLWWESVRCNAHWRIVGRDGPIDP